MFTRAFRFSSTGGLYQLLGDTTNMSQKHGGHLAQMRLMFCVLMALVKTVHTLMSIYCSCKILCYCVCSSFASSMCRLVFYCRDNALSMNRGVRNETRNTLFDFFDQGCDAILTPLKVKYIECVWFFCNDC